jgi:predicted enzyme related to lactoylglutathione lyase
MITSISHISLFVLNQDDALNFYNKLGFKVHTDEMFGEMRWLTLYLPHQKDLELVLMSAQTAEEKALVGKQGASKPFFNLITNDCNADYQALKKLGVAFLGEPEQQPWGWAVALQDLYGNALYLCQPA